MSLYPCNKPHVMNGSRPMSTPTEESLALLTISAPHSETTPYTMQPITIACLSIFFAVLWTAAGFIAYDNRDTRFNDSMIHFILTGLIQSVGIIAAVATLWIILAALSLSH